MSRKDGGQIPQRGLEVKAEGSGERLLQVCGMVAPERSDIAE